MRCGISVIDRGSPPTAPTHSSRRSSEYSSSVKPRYDDFSSGCVAPTRDRLAKTELRLQLGDLVPLVARMLMHLRLRPGRLGGAIRAAIATERRALRRCASRHEPRVPAVDAEPHHAAEKGSGQEERGERRHAEDPDPLCTARLDHVIPTTIAIVMRSALRSRNREWLERDFEANGAHQEVDISVS